MKLNKNVKPEITAEWARNEGNKIMSYKVEEELTNILIKIEKAIEDDESIIILDSPIHSKTKKILENRGFLYKSNQGRRMEASYNSISW